jgi:hypothetical protein
MCKDLEAELSILVQQLQPARRVVTAISLNEILIAEQAFEIDAHLLAAGRAWITSEC